MGACCCCCAEDENPPPYQRQQRQRQTPAPPHSHCRVCGLEVDPAIIDGHEERCRAAQRRAVGSQQYSPSDAPPSPAPKNIIFSPDLTEEEVAAIGNEDPDALCIICCERLRTYAFLPCGHLCACTTCTIPMSLCPVCRVPREGLLYVDPKSNELCVCKHCRNVICPTFFDAHRETCALRMRQARDAEMSARNSAQPSPSNPASPSPPQSPPFIPGSDVETALLTGPSTQPTTPPDESSSEVTSPVQTNTTSCVDCHNGPRDIALIPCGHTCLCAECAPSHTQCPICCEDVTSRVRTFR